jgi:hypothetical protein
VHSLSWSRSLEVLPLTNGVVSMVKNLRE